MIEEDYCTCEENSGVSPDQNDEGHWLVCSGCEKVIEDTFEYFNYNSNDYYG
ncbi:MULTISPECIES: hypothetical protein [Bacillus]|uniref:hypothetical protein n=1 Tax=Bacillus TaxID=1386 RepID=UPI0008151DFC|nr:MULTISPECIES: hypothetical protein [Bacillus]MDU0070681.1 hypothetical protein [Bacillus sp. IG6]MEC5225256.1 hypothetical protein [Bacillus licheniformis]MED4337830.1 hypothetical protein [Bacillus licheniformis]MED4373564.1 hypothetical protein [Bacillus licheniformis]MED8018545.1 hypothetical protein [Bacillus glycinifermentans]